MLQAIGNAMDLPGSMVRDTLTLNNPLDQLLDPFGDSNRTSGAQMLEGLGMDPGHSILGTVLEMGLDPATYLGAGLATRGAKALGLAGKARAGIAGARHALQSVSSPSNLRWTTANAANAARNTAQQVQAVARAAMANPSRIPGAAAMTAQHFGNAAVNGAYAAAPGLRDLSLAAALGLPAMARAGDEDERGGNMIPASDERLPVIPANARFSLSGLSNTPMRIPGWTRGYRYSVGYNRPGDGPEDTWSPVHR